LCNNCKGIKIIDLASAGGYQHPNIIDELDDDRRGYYLCDKLFQRRWISNIKSKKDEQEF
jgi:hypothetical protein